MPSTTITVAQQSVICLFGSERLCERCLCGPCSTQAMLMSLYIAAQAAGGVIVSLLLLATGGPLNLRLGRAGASAASGTCYVSVFL